MIGLLIVTHCDLGREFLNAAEFIVGSVQGADSISITQTSDSEEIHKLITEKITALNDGNGVIILTDMFGGTPSNISLSFLEDERVEVITGVNLPMVLAIAQNRNGCELGSLAKKARDAAKMGISLAGHLLK
ncbi:MAG: PTS fructose transporter subunit IIA [Desulfobacteraceae bacterium]|jgi:PTS system mannose-specific IIA component